MPEDHLLRKVEKAVNFSFIHDLCKDLYCSDTKTENGRRLYNWRKQTIERSFAEGKENHGLRCARMLGIKNMREQCFLTAAVQNMKRLIKAG